MVADFISSNLTEKEYAKLTKELNVAERDLFQKIEMLVYSDNVWAVSPPSILKMWKYFADVLIDYNHTHP